MLDTWRMLLEESGALRHGHFLLSSGLHSPAYVQCALLLEQPDRARRVGSALAAKLGSLRPEAVVSPALGGLIVGFATAASLGVPFRFTERSEGRMELRRGFTVQPGERIAVVEDVVTTGKSTRETMAVLKTLGAEIVAVGAILDRTGSGSPDASDPLGPSDPFEVPFETLLSLDLPTYAAEACPKCAEGSRPEKPGSRTLPAPPG
jgi:orotate phosphoribosyltransferase